MRKPSLVFTMTTVVLSAAGMLLRRVELRTAVEADTGLTVFVPATVLLAALTLLGALAFFLLARSLREAAIPSDYGGAFQPATALPLLASVLCLGALLAGAYLCLARWRDQGSGLCAVLALLAGLSGAGWFSLCLDRLRKKRGSFYAGAAQVLFLCFFLITYYKEYAPEPALLRTIYTFLGLCAAVLAQYTFAGFTVGKAAPKKLLFLSGLSIYLLLVSAVGVSEPEYRLFQAATALELYINAVLLLQPRPEPAESAA